MELIERDDFLATLLTAFDGVTAGKGHCMLISGESGIGKTSLVNAFCSLKTTRYKIFSGSCDALFTPRLLAPFYDIALQLQCGILNNWDITDRTALFSRLFHEISELHEPVVIIFEDIHWADEATLDFIKFMARRIALTKCFFILTYRDNEIHPQHPLRSVLGQLPPYIFTRLQLPPLSKQAVETMAQKRGYVGEDVYSISGGNPFYVNEILASYSPGIPQNIKDSVLSVYALLNEHTKSVWNIMAVLPSGIETRYLSKMEAAYSVALENCLNLGILLIAQNRMFFKHELYRRTIEASLSPLMRIELNKRILDLFLGDFEKTGEIERIVHHAKNAEEYDMVVKYAPLAAKKAAKVGAHIQAAKLYLTTITYYTDSDQSQLLNFYEAYAYECYLTNQTQEAITYQEKVLNICKAHHDIEKTGDCLWFLSRLCWFAGNRKQAELYAIQAIEVLATQPPSRAKAMTFSNMSQLKMLSNEAEECITWGEQAIAMAEHINDEEVHCHALNNIGTVQMSIPSSKQKGVELLQQSLAIALSNSYHEHAARAYTNLGAIGVDTKDFDFAENILNEGIAYCRTRELGSWTTYMSSHLARLYVDTGKWDKAACITGGLIENELQSSVVKIVALVVLATVKLRRGEDDALPLLMEAKTKAFETDELQRIIPALVALLEYEWLTETKIIDDRDINYTINTLGQTSTVYQRNELAFWLYKARKQVISVNNWQHEYRPNDIKAAQRSAAYWQKLNCPYEQALMLFEGNVENKREAIAILQGLGAVAISEKLKQTMRATGIKSIPRGIRQSTRANIAHLTGRELDVLQLLKQGLKNKEIADKLFISAKTVDHHISSILVKLDVDSRAKAVNEAARLNAI